MHRHSGASPEGHFVTSFPSSYFALRGCQFFFKVPILRVLRLESPALLVRFGVTLVSGATFKEFVPGLFQGVYIMCFMAMAATNSCPGRQSLYPTSLFCFGRCFGGCSLMSCAMGRGKRKHGDHYGVLLHSSYYRHHGGQVD